MTEANFRVDRRSMLHFHRKSLAIDIFRRGMALVGGNRGIATRRGYPKQHCQALRGALAAFLHRRPPHTVLLYQKEFGTDLHTAFSNVNFLGSVRGIQLCFDSATAPS